MPSQAHVIWEDANVTSGIELTQIFSELGYEVTIRRGEGGSTGESSYAYFNLRGREKGGG